jgi:hypothetical protein
MWWIPLLVIFGIWRHFSRGESARYEFDLWSVVFSIGISFMVTMAHLGTWLAQALFG